VVTPTLPLAGLALVGAAVAATRLRPGRPSIGLGAMLLPAALVAVVVLAVAITPRLGCPATPTVAEAARRPEGRLGQLVVVRRGGLSARTVTAASGTRSLHVVSPGWPPGTPLGIVYCPTRILQEGSWPRSALFAAAGPGCMDLGAVGRASPAGRLDVVVQYPVAVPGTDCGAEGACVALVYADTEARLAHVR